MLSGVAVLSSRLVDGLPGGPGHAPSPVPRLCALSHPPPRCAPSPAPAPVTPAAPAPTGGPAHLGSWGGPDWSTSLNSAAKPWERAYSSRPPTGLVFRYLTSWPTLLTLVGSAGSRLSPDSALALAGCGSRAHPDGIGQHARQRRGAHGRPEPPSGSETAPPGPRAQRRSPPRAGPSWPPLPPSASPLSCWGRSQWGRCGPPRPHSTGTYGGQKGQGERARTEGLLHPPRPAVSLLAPAPQPAPPPLSTWASAPFPLPQEPLTMDVGSASGRAARVRPGPVWFCPPRHPPDGWTAHPARLGPCLTPGGPRPRSPHPRLGSRSDRSETLCRPGGGREGTYGSSEKSRGRDT